MRPLVLIALFVSLSACRTEPDKPDTGDLPGETGSNAVDADGDGYSSDEDCDDSDPTVHPGAEETCNDQDDDCDGETDEGLMGSYYADVDGDGFGDADSWIEACEPSSGYVEDSTDCDDSAATTYPEAPERCDGLDNDCDGEIDEDLYEIWYADADGDGYGNAESSIDSCDPGEGWVIDASDCDDSNSSVNPGAEEACNDIDDDCDGEVDEELESNWYADADGDGFGDPAVEVVDCEPGAGWVEDAADCDDANSSINPDAQEICDSLDNDCDGLVDDDDDSIDGTSTWYADADGDGFGDDGAVMEACNQPSGYAEYGGDCDDSDPAPSRTTAPTRPTTTATAPPATPTPTATAGPPARTATTVTPRSTPTPKRSATTSMTTATAPSTRTAPWTRTPGTPTPTVTASATSAAPPRPATSPPATSAPPTPPTATTPTPTSAPWIPSAATVWTTTATVTSTRA
jgi:hypothetical protein